MVQREENLPEEGAEGHWYSTPQAGLTPSIMQLTSNAANRLSGNVRFSPDGSNLLFISNSSNLAGVTGADTNNTLDLFVTDLATGQITRLSSNASGDAADGSSSGGTFSLDGTKVLFQSNATNLAGVTGADTNGTTDLFVTDLATGQITRLSSNASGDAANSFSSGGEFSADGTKVLFQSNATNLAGVTGADTNGAADLFVADLATGQITRVSSNTAGDAANRASAGGTFSPDGTKVLFQSNATNLAGVTGADTNGTFDIFVADLASGQIDRISNDAAGNAAERFSNLGTFSPDGTKALFQSNAANLAGVTGADTNGAADVFVADLATGLITRISNNAAGDAPNGFSRVGMFSSDGSKISFISNAPELFGVEVGSDEDFDKLGLFVATF